MSQPGSHTQVPPQAEFFRMIMGGWVTQCLGVAARLGIADLIASGTESSQELAIKTQANPGALYRLLRGCASVGVFKENTSNRTFSNTPLSECLRSNSPESMRELLITWTSPGHWLPWGHLHESVMTGKHAARSILGMDIWDYYRNNREEGIHFSRAMSNFSAMVAAETRSNFDFSRFEVIVDVGGAHGMFLANALKANPKARGILCDLPEVIDAAKEDVKSMEIASRCELKSGDFFKSIPSGGDLYMLKHILHDWNDDECVQILKNCRASIQPGGRLLVVEMLITEDGSSSHAPLLDVNMLVMLTGRERTADEFEALFSASNFKTVRVVKTLSPVSLIEAEPI